MNERARTISIRRKQRPDQALLAALGQLPPATMNAGWLGALLTVRLSDGPTAEEAEAINIALVHLRAMTLDGEAVMLTPHSEDLSAAHGQALAQHLDVHAMRHALIHELKLSIGYTDAKGRATLHTVWPIDVEDYGPSGAMLAWCEKRRSFWKFRFDRVTTLNVQPELTEASQEVTLRLRFALSGDIDADMESRG
jgi:predicted DNA-binding transcriptional regulator YafY